MDFAEKTDLNLVSFTPSAANATNELMAKKNLVNYALRLFISGGGCSGFQYGLVLDSNIRNEDLMIETNGVKLIIDEVSIKYLEGATVDYVDGLEGSGFKILNPNAFSSCNCGQSSSSSEESSAENCSGCG